jgi:hypothetical protein
VADVPQSRHSTLQQVIKPHPIHIDLPGAEAIVHVANTLAQMAYHAGGLQRRAAGFYGDFIAGYTSNIVVSQSSCRPISIGCHDQFMEQRPSYRAGFALDIMLCIRGILSEFSHRTDSEY